MKWLKQPWSELTEATIKNCFKHCSFRQDASASEEHLGHDPNLQSLFEELQQHGASIDGTLEDFRTSDNHVETTGTFSNRKIVDSVLGREEEYKDEANDDDNKPIVCATVGAFRAALEVVSCLLCKLLL